METIFFDLDGTLTDSGLGITRSIAYALNKLGKEIPDQGILEKFIGPPLADSFQTYTGLTPEEAQQGIDFYREYYSVTGIYENSLYTGIPELLRDLKKKDLDLYLTTSKPEFFAKKILVHFEIAEFFSGVFGASMDEKLSEKTEIIKNALQTITPTVSPCKTLMVGDRSYDILGAKDHGLHSCGVLYGFGTKKELEKAGADFLINTPGELLTIL